MLLVGDDHKVFTKADSITQLPWQVRSNMIDAIDIAANKSFDAIAIVMAGATAKLNYALKALRKVSGKAKIVLLAQVHEEPRAA